MDATRHPITREPISVPAVAHGLPSASRKGGIHNLNGPPVLRAVRVVPDTVDRRQPNAK